PKGFGGNEPTGAVTLLSHWLPQPAQVAMPDFISFPPQKAVSVPPRAAYSHSASVGKRYRLPACADNHLPYSTASCHEKLMTGCRPRPPPPSFGSSRFVAWANLSYSSKVTSYRPMAKGFWILTVRTGSAALSRPPHRSPICNNPAVHSTISLYC